MVLVEPEIHWNTGNAGRTCLAAGAQLHLVEPLGFSLEAHQVKRAGLDYWPLVDPVVWASFDALEEKLQDLGAPLFVTPGGKHLLWDAELSPEEDVVLLFGKESTGFSDAILARYREQTVRLPMAHQAVRSLNVSTCVGIAVYETLRRRR